MSGLTAGFDNLYSQTAFLYDMANGLPAMIGYWTTNLQCSFANEKYRDWFGHRQHPVNGMSLKDFIGADLFAKDRPFIDKVLRGEKCEFERTLIRPPDKLMYTITNLIPHRDNDVIHGFFVLITDITEFKNLQVELMVLNSELELRTKQAEAASQTKSQFLANMSHELRTPLASIISITGLLAEENLSDEQQRNVRLLQSSGERLLNRVNDILDTIKIETGNVVLEEISFDLSELMRDAANLFSTSAVVKDLDVIAHLPGEIPPLLVGDPVRLWQIITNLMNNAVKFTVSGQVELAAEILERDEESITIRFSVTDTGIGIPLPVQERIFSAFVQADNSTTRKYGGTGLGLAICKQLVELMGGAIKVQSSPGEGSQFSFVLKFRIPLKQQVVPEAAAIPATDQPVGRAGIYALIVEDDPVNQSIMAATLTRLGHRADIAENGAEALRKLRERNYDLVFMDYMMPEMDGLEATRRIRQAESPVLDRQVPIVMWSANALPEFEEQCLASGVNAVLIKPAEKRRIMKVIAELCP